MRTAWLASIACSLLVAVSTSAVAATVKQHRLRVAFNPSIGYTNDDIDAIIAKMNKAARVADFNWDTQCDTIEFVRDGDVMPIAALPVSGDFTTLIPTLQQMAPNANVLVTLSMTCSGVNAAGCAGTSTAMIVIPDGPGRTPIVWTHERGHVMGLDHVAQNQDRNQIPEDQSHRVMFWNPFPEAKGLANFECDAYRRSVMPAPVDIVDAQETTSAIGAVADNAAVAPTTIGSPAVAAPAGAPAPAVDDTSAASRAILTPRAFDVIDSTWQHAFPLEAIKQLDARDIESVRAFIKSGADRYNLPHAMQVLAYRGTADDVAYLKSVLALPTPAIADPTQVTAEAREQARSIRQSKLQVPESVGILVNRTRSTEGESMLTQFADAKRAQDWVGAELLPEFNRKALTGMALAQSARTTGVANAIFDKFKLGVVIGGPSPSIIDPAIATNPSIGELASPSATDAHSAKRVFDTVEAKGLDFYLTNGVGN